MIRTGIGFDIHRLAPGRKLILGGVRIESDCGLAGHSDADVLCHAVIDALLGAVADGDIGTHFPDNDPCWKDADSLKMLASVAGRLRLKGTAVINIDATVLAEKPRLTPYREAMRGKLAQALGIEESKVSIKATTSETLGALGRGEGIAAMAVAAVEERSQ
ncbi:MAG: 2-C-methyl-D-erythritol 2,4-cyclodiphosphate synthase [Kiritimatiellia bacterium]|nr:2-C-methyl-D-erythritol 2,4-cyclodiphosphate synthase [Kiritimatiellia bacterium]